MPFKSEAQRRFLWAKHPEIAKRWTKKYGSKIQHELDKKEIDKEAREHPSFTLEQVLQIVKDHKQLKNAKFCRLGKLWRQAKHSGVAQMPVDATKLTQGQPLTGKHVLQHGKLPEVKTARFANFEMKQFAEMEVNFLKEGWYRTNGKAYYYPWEVLERDAETFKGKEFYLNHEEEAGAEMGVIENVYPRIVNGTNWLIAKIRVPEASFTKPFLERVENGLVRQVSSTHDFIIDEHNPNVVQKMVGKGISAVKEGEVEGTGIIDFKKGLKSASYKKEQRKMISKLWENKTGGIRG